MKYPYQRKYWLKKKQEGYRNYVIFDNPETIEKMRKYYHALKGIKPKSKQ